MVENVTDIFAARSCQPEGLRTMIVWSVAGHVALGALALLWDGAAVEPQRLVMTVTLSGAPGPVTGGRTPIGGQAVQAPQPEPVAKAVETPPAAKAPELSLPSPRVVARPRPKPEQAPPDATARTPNTGRKPRAGSTRVRGLGFDEGQGLSSAGGSGGAVRLDVVDFCCNEYVTQIVETTGRSWNQRHGFVGSTTMVFTIQRNGVITSPMVERSSGFAVLDNAAFRALQLTRLPPLPAAFEHPTLTVHLRSVRFLERQVSLTPNNAAAHRALGRAYVDQGREDVGTG